MIVRYTDKAREDIDVAIAWYERQYAGLGLGFLGCIEAAVDQISLNPLIYELVYDAFRRCVVRNYPFSIFIP